MARTKDRRSVASPNRDRIFVTIRGKKYEIIFKEPPQEKVHDAPKGEKTIGICASPSYKRPKILVDPALKGRLRLEIIIHEFLHAALWDLDEDAVIEIAKDLSKTLIKTGYKPI